MRSISRTTIMTATAPAVPSATGPAYIMPSIPINLGKIRISGSSRMICLVSDRNVPDFGLPIEVKKLDEIGCIKFIHVQNRYILK